MAIARSIEQRVAEAVHIKLAADADLQTLCAGSADDAAVRIFYGPEGGFVLGQLPIAAYQINVIPGSSQAKGATGVSGRTERDVMVVVAYFSPYNPSKITTGGAGNSSGVSVCKHIDKLLRAGAGDTPEGRLADPDNVVPRITLGIKNIGIRQPQVIANGLLGWIIEATFYTIENKTGERA